MSVIKLLLPFIIISMLDSIAGISNKEQIINNTNEESSDKYADEETKTDGTRGTITTTTTTSTTPTPPTTTSTFITTTTTPPSTSTTQRSSTTTYYTSSSTSSPPQPTVCPQDKIYNPVLEFLTFPETPIQTWAIPIEPCLQSNYTPVRRFCLKNGSWDKVQGECSNQTTPSEATNTLYNLVDATNTTEALEQTCNITEKSNKELKPIDIHLISKILDKVSEDNQNFHKIINNIMTVDKQILNSAQSQLNSTDKILYSLDKILLKTSTTINVSLPYLLVYTVNPVDAIGARIKGENFASFEIIPLTYEDYKEELEVGDYQIAFEVPQQFTQHNDYYFITLFYNDGFFNPVEEGNGYKPGSWILSILLPNVTTNPENQLIKIYYKEFNPSLHQGCNHWRYGYDGNNPIQGKWKTDNQAIKFKDGFYVCEMNHTTHFGMLVSGSLPESFILDLLTIFGTILSLFGIGVIFLTAITFKRWRDNLRNKIILNVALALLLTIILFFISDRVGKGTGCIILGILLHYVILAQLCWALVLTHSIFRQINNVFAEQITHVLIKYCAVAWGIPLVIVAITAGISVDTYDKKLEESTSEICYPKDWYLKFGLLLPMFIILTINLVVYILIVKKLTVKKLEIQIHKHAEKSCCSAEQKFMILCFFMMGITWIFGILSAFINNIIFAYLFCTMSTTHGFVMFLFFILDDEKTRKMWKNKLQSLCKTKKTQKDVSDADTATASISNAR